MRRFGFASKNDGFVRGIREPQAVPEIFLMRTEFAGSPGSTLFPVQTEAFTSTKLT